MPYKVMLGSPHSCFFFHFNFSFVSLLFFGVGLYFSFNHHHHHHSTSQVLWIFYFQYFCSCCCYYQQTSLCVSILTGSFRFCYGISFQLFCFILSDLFIWVVFSVCFKFIYLFNFFYEAFHL